MIRRTTLLSTDAVTRRSPRPVVLACSLLLLATQALGVAHELTARHTVCADHGEVIEGEGAHLEAKVAPAAPSVDAATAAAAEASHQHCQLVATRDARLPALQPSAALLLPRVPLAQPAWKVSPRAAAEPLFRLAPKSSPPSAA